MYITNFPDYKKSVNSEPKNPLAVDSQSCINHMTTDKIQCFLPSDHKLFYLFTLSDFSPYKAFMMSIFSRNTSNA